MFVQRFTLAVKATERKIISAGIVVKASPVNRKTCVMSNTNTFPARISSMMPGLYKKLSEK